MSRDVLFLIDPARWRLDAKIGSSIAKCAVTVVHHQLVGPVVKRVTHPRCDEDVFIAVVVVVAGGDAPGPEGLQTRGERGLGELSLAEIPVKSVPEKQVVVILALRCKAGALVEH